MVYIKISLSLRILTAVLVPVILVFTLFILITNNVINETCDINARSLTENLSHDSKQIIESKFDSLWLELQLITKYISGYNPEHEDYSENIDTVLNDVLEVYPFIYASWVVLENEGNDYLVNALYHSNDSIYNAKQAVIDLLESDNREWYDIPFSTGQPYFTPIDFYNYNNDNELHYVCYLSYPISDDSGKIIGVAGFDVIYNQLISVLFELKSNIGTLLLLNNDGSVIYSTNENLQGENITELIASKNKHSVSSQVSDSIENNRMLITNYNSLILDTTAYFCLQSINPKYSAESLFLSFDIPSKVLLESSESGIRLVFLSSIIGFLLLVIAIFLITRSITRPIKQLINTSDEIADGNLDIDFGKCISIKGNFKDEISLLQTSLEKMVNQLNLAHDLSIQHIEAKLEKEKAIASSRAKTIFFTNMSHEIRTPMNSILGIAQILLTENQLTEKQRKYIGDIKISADSLLCIINDILDLSKLESSKMSLYLHDFNFTQLVDSINSLAEFLTGQKSIEYKFNIIGKLPHCLYGDDVRLKQVIVNIIGNAVKFTAKGFVSFQIIVSDDSLVFEVRDTGTGIREEQLSTIFDAFEQAENSAPGKGTGLGLPISKNLIELMNGKIEFTSEHGIGSVFTITIPKILGDKNKLKSNEAKTDLYFSTETRILIVDDNEINLQVASGLVSTIYGIDCDIALSGKEALSYIESNDYDLVFMDHMMPEMDGVQTTIHIREMGGKRADMPIVALTANAVIGTKELLIKSGMNDFLSKPIMTEELNKILQKWLPKEKRVLKTDKPPVFQQKSKTNHMINVAMEINGLDVNEGLSNAAFKEEVYENSLKLLSDKIPSITKTLTDCLNNGNIKDFCIHVHGMKSSLAIVGASSLSKLAFNLEKAAKEENIDFCKDTFPIFAEHMKNLNEQLLPLFKVKEHTHTEKGTAENFKENFEKLIEYTKSYNYEMFVGIILEMSKFDFGRTINEDIQKLKKLSEVFDYNGISQTIDDIKAELENNPAMFE